MKSKESSFQRHIVEIIAGAFGVLLAIIAGTTLIDQNTALLMGAVSASLALSIAILKDFYARNTGKLFHEIRNIVSEVSTINKKMTEAIDVFAEIDGVHLAHASKELDGFLGNLKKIKYGRLRLTESQYYERIIERMKLAKAGDRILATNSIDERRWDREPRQLNYMAANKQAMDNGAKISRIFIVDKRNLGDARYEEGFSEIDRQLHDPKVDAHVVWRQDLPAKEDLVKDWVLFEGDYPEVFQAYADDGSGSSHRVWWAELIIGKGHDGEENAHNYRRDFKKLLSFELSQELFRKEVLDANIASGLALEKSQEQNLAPGNFLEVHELQQPVTSCEEAAAAKGIPLSKELKTLVLDTSNGLVAVHVRGNEEVSLRKVKKSLGVAEAKLADRGQLDNLGVVPGTVSPIVDPIWELKHLLDERVLNNEFVSTNNGTLRAYVTFDPDILLKAKDVQTGDFTKTLSE